MKYRSPVPGHSHPHLHLRILSLSPLLHWWSRWGPAAAVAFDTSAALPAATSSRPSSWPRRCGWLWRLRFGRPKKWPWKSRDLYEILGLECWDDVAICWNDLFKESAVHGSFWPKNWPSDLQRGITVEASHQNTKVTKEEQEPRKGTPCHSQLNRLRES